MKQTKKSISLGRAQRNARDLFRRVFSNHPDPKERERADRLYEALEHTVFPQLDQQGLEQLSDALCWVDIALYDTSRRVLRELGGTV